MSEFKLRGGVADLPILTAVVITIVPGKSAPKGRSPTQDRCPMAWTRMTAATRWSRSWASPSCWTDFFNSGRWLVDGHHVSILFTDDWKTIRQLGVTMQDAI